MPVEVVVRGKDESSAAMASAAKGIEQVGAAGTAAEGKMKGFFSLMGGVGLGSLAAVGGGFAAAAATGLSFNNSMEQSRARINAFTKDAAVTEQVLAMVTERAAKTPFAFEEMAGAAAALGPAAKSSGVELETLLEKAEILAASNPAEGLEGAAFALKEALSGDFTSAIERFNLSRSYINELRAQGVPDLEALSMAMEQAGYDTDLVSQLANTAQGRWSTFMDTWTVLAGMVTQPIFDAVSQGLGTANDLLTQFSPVMQQAAQTVAGFISQAIQGQGAVGSLMGALQPVVDFLQANWQPIVAAAGAILAFGIGGAVATAVAALGAFLAAAAPVIAILAVVGAAAAALQGAWANNFGGIQQTTASAMAAIQAVISAVLGVVQEFWAQNGASIIAFTQQTWATIQQIIGTVGAIIGTIVTTVFGAVASFIGSHGAQIQQILSAAWEFISGTITTALEVIQGITTAILAALQGDWGGATEAIKGIVSSLGTYLSEQWENIKGLVVALGPQLLSAAQDVGNSIVEGIAGGISSAAGKIAEAAQSAAQSALNAAKSALGIQSPSKVFAQAVGLPIAQGMAQGISQGAPLVADSVVNVARGGVQAASKSIQTVTVNQTINQAPGERYDQFSNRTLAGLSTAVGLIR